MELSHVIAFFVGFLVNQLATKFMQYELHTEGYLTLGDIIVRKVRATAT